MTRCHDSTTLQYDDIGEDDDDDDDDGDALTFNEYPLSAV